MATHETSPLLENLQGVIITDCSDPNAQARQEVRFANLFGIRPMFVGLTADRELQDLETAGLLVDVLDAADTHTHEPQKPNVILANVAPRGDDVREHWENGTPFCHFNVAGNTVLAPFEGRALLLAQKLGLVSAVNVLDIRTVTKFLTAEDVLKRPIARAINDSQFRSLHFLPLAARELIKGRNLPAKPEQLKPAPQVEPTAWYVDSFGNLKTTLLKADVNFQPGKVVKLANGEKAVCYRRLADVPTDELALTVGSSGYGTRRWLEVVIQKGDAAKELGFKIGSPMLDGVVERPLNR